LDPSVEDWLALVLAFIDNSRLNAISDCRDILDLAKISSEKDLLPRVFVQRLEVDDTWF
jgi:hypothetical protein